MMWLHYRLDKYNLCIRRKKNIGLFAKNRPGELFLPLYPAGGIAPISIFPFLNPYKCFCYKIFSCNSDNRLSLLYSSTGYGRNILWEDTKDFCARTNNSSRWQVVGDCRIFKTGVNNYQKKRFSGLPGNFHFAHAVFRKQSIFLYRLRWLEALN